MLVEAMVASLLVMLVGELVASQWWEMLVKAMIASVASECFKVDDDFYTEVDVVVDQVDGGLLASMYKRAT